MAGELPWSAQQREWLQALGHDVLGLAADSVSAGVPDADADADAAPPPGPSTRGHPAASRSTLLQALARAAARDEDDPELLRALPDLAGLRTPTARRALWPRLRALRRTPR